MHAPACTVKFSELVQEAIQMMFPPKTTTPAAWLITAESTRTRIAQHVFSNLSALTFAKASVIARRSEIAKGVWLLRGHL